MTESILRRLIRRVRIPKETSLDGITVALASLPLPRPVKRRILGGGYESHERVLIKQALKTGDRVLELGASLGIVSSLILRLIGPSGRLVAVEADPKLHDSFRRQLGANELECELVHALCCPIWTDRVPDHIARSVFQQSTSTLSGKAVSSDNRTCSPWKTAGTICGELNLDPNVLVCDIEGAESVWAESDSPFPDCLEKIIVELHPWINGPEVAGAVLESMRQVGFEISGFSGTVFYLRRRPSPLHR